MSEEKKDLAQRAAEALSEILGVRFAVEDGVVNNIDGLSDRQSRMLQHLCERTGTVLGLSNGNKDCSIDVDKIRDETVNFLKNTVDNEKNRLLALQTGKAKLTEYLGFNVYDADNKKNLIISKKDISGYSADGLVSALKKDGVIKIKEDIEGNIVVMNFDIDKYNKFMEESKKWVIGTLTSSTHDRGRGK